MAAIWGAIISAAAGGISGAGQKRTSKRAAAAQRKAYEDAIRAAESRLGPYSAFGKGALRNLGRLTGNREFLNAYGSPEAEELASLKSELESLQAPTSTEKNAGWSLHRKRRNKIKRKAYTKELAAYEGNKSKLEARIAELEQVVAKQKAEPQNETMGADYLKELPGYQFRLKEGEDMVSAAQSRRNMALSGAALKELSQYNQDFASTEYDKEFNRLMGMAGLGQSTDTGLANLAMGFGAANANIAQGYGQDLATTYATYNNAIQSGLKNYQYQQRTNQMGQNQANPDSTYGANQYGPAYDLSTDTNQWVDGWPDK